MKLSKHHVQRLIVALWTFWYTSIVCTNATDLLKQAGVLASDFAWSSNNYAMFVGAAQVEGAAKTAVIVLYLCGYCWELTTAVFLWRALVKGFQDPANQAHYARPAFTLALGFWGAFMVVSEASIAVTPPLYIALFSAVLLSLGLVELLPEREGPA